MGIPCSFQSQKSTALEQPGKWPRTGEEAKVTHQQAVVPLSWVQYQLPVIPALGRMKQNDGEFKATLGYTES